MNTITNCCSKFNPELILSVFNYCPWCGNKLLVGTKLNKWLVLSKTTSDDRGNIMYMCKCDCGIIKPVKRTDLLREKSKSCGCLRKSIRTKEFRL